MSWYLIVKFIHILAVTITIGGMFARQLVRGIASKNSDVNTVASLTHVATRIDRTMVIPWSNIIFLMGIVLAVMLKWPILGFLQGASQNWLLVSNILLIMMLALIPTVFIPHNKKVEAVLQDAISNGNITPELTALLNDKKNALAHYSEDIIVLAITALMVLKPF
jgi:uncharacterized membrane protein